MTETQIPPIAKSIEVPCGVDEAFAQFTERIGAWWPLKTHSILGEEAAGCAMEGRAGGRVWEWADDGREREWGQVQVWEPSTRVVFTFMTWRSGGTEVEVRFTAAGDGRTRVDLEHRCWDRVTVDDPTGLRAGYDTGWDHVLGECYAGSL